MGRVDRIVPHSYVYILRNWMEGCGQEVKLCQIPVGGRLLIGCTWRCASQGVTLVSERKGGLKWLGGLIEEEGRGKRQAGYEESKDARGDR